MLGAATTKSVRCAAPERARRLYSRLSKIDQTRRSIPGDDGQRLIVLAVYLGFIFPMLRSGLESIGGLYRHCKIAGNSILRLNQASRPESSIRLPSAAIALYGSHWHLGRNIPLNQTEWNAVALWPAMAALGSISQLIERTRREGMTSFDGILEI